MKPYFLALIFLATVACAECPTYPRHWSAPHTLEGVVDIRYLICNDSNLIAAEVDHWKRDGMAKPYTVYDVRGSEGENFRTLESAKKRGEEIAESCGPKPEWMTR